MFLLNKTVSSPFAGTVAAMLALWACVASAQPNEGRIADSETFSPHAVVAGKSISKSECSALQYAVWVEHQHGAECLRYYPSPGIDGAARVVVYTHGDQALGTRVIESYGKASPASLMKQAAAYARQHQVPFMYLARPGIFGSSGEHLQRRRPKEFYSINYRGNHSANAMTC